MSMAPQPTLLRVMCPATILTNARNSVSRLSPALLAVHSRGNDRRLVLGDHVLAGPVGVLAAMGLDGRRLRAQRDSRVLRQVSLLLSRRDWLIRISNFLPHQKSTCTDKSDKKLFHVHTSAVSSCN